MKTNRFYTIAALVLMLLLSGETIFLLNTNQHRSVLAKHVTELEQTIQRKKEENEKLTHENSQLKDSLELTNLEKQQSAEKILELEEEIKSLEKQLADAQKDLVSKNAQIANLREDIVKTKDKFMCSTSLSRVDFTSNATVNNVLKNYVNRIKNMNEPISASYWNQIWTGKNYSIHTIEVYSEKDNTNYLWKFTVYFRGEAYGEHEYGIFYNDNQCWLYLDK
ncbi:MAG: hypothetical protein KatS3mg045_1230 [Bellilinea sp.]|nr:MAG: hypothetical protein KatS3mg045_1230 [Bellilinea sp.]